MGPNKKEFVSNAGFKRNFVLREDDKVYLKDVPEELVEYANDRILLDAFKRSKSVSKAYLMRKYQITWKTAYILSLQLLQLFLGNMCGDETIELEESDKSKKRRFH